MQLARKIYTYLYCLIATIAYLIVVFDATYLYPLPYVGMTMRDVYLEYLPQSFHYRYTDEEKARFEERDPYWTDRTYDPNRLFYDPIKGIEPHRDTHHQPGYGRSFEDGYIPAWNRLKELYAASEPDPVAIQAQLAKMRALSVEMIDAKGEEAWFRYSNKQGDLERAKNLMREHMELESSKRSFAAFFDYARLSDATVRENDFQWFQDNIARIINRNYFRWNGEDGEPKDFFYFIDVWFVLFFVLDFFGRWIWSIYRKEYRKWYLFVVRNWYDVFNLFPPQHAVWWRLLRVIPLVARLRSAGLLPGASIAPDLVRENASVIASEISGLVLINILDQSSRIIEERGLGDLTSVAGEEMLDGMLDEVQDLLKTQTEMISEKVVPEIQPKVAALTEYAIDQTMRPYLASPIGPAMRLILNNVYSQLRTGLHSALAGEGGVERMKEIMQIFVAALLKEVSKAENMRIAEKQIAKLLQGIKRQVEHSVHSGKMAPPSRRPVAGYLPEQTGEGAPNSPGE